jgi:hypothetical protein
LAARALLCACFVAGIGCGDSGASDDAMRAAATNDEDDGGAQDANVRAADARSDGDPEQNADLDAASRGSSDARSAGSDDAGALRDAAVDSAQGLEDVYVGPSGSDGLALYPPSTRHSPITAAVATNFRSILANNASRNRKNFIRLGDNASYAGRLLSCFDAKSKSAKLGATGYVQTTVDYFNGGMIKGGTPFAYTVDLENMTPWSIVDGSKSFLQSQIDEGNPSFALLSLAPIVHAGVGEPNQDDHLVVENTGPTMLQIVDTLIAQGVLPVMRSVHPYDNAQYPELNLLIPLANELSRAIAQGRQIPFTDAYLDFVTLDGRGYESDGSHLSEAASGPCDLTESSFVYGDNRLNRVVIEQLDRVKRAAIDSEVPDATAPTRDGKGTASEPFLAHALPFTDLRPLAVGGVMADYSACGGAKAEGAAEVVYRFDTPATIKLRAFVFDRVGSAIDTWVHHFASDLKTCRSSKSSLLELELAPGTHYFVVDGPKSGSGASSEYAFGLVACGASDTTCKTDVH